MSTPFTGSFQTRHSAAPADEAASGASGKSETGGSRGLTIPARSDVQEGAIRASQPGPRSIARENYTEDGIYIPLSGGSRGWFENSGVPAAELQNGYRQGGLTG